MDVHPGHSNPYMGGHQVLRPSQGPGSYGSLMQPRTDNTFSKTPRPPTGRVGLMDADANASVFMHNPTASFSSMHVGSLDQEIPETSRPFLLFPQSAPIQPSHDAFVPSKYELQSFESSFPSRFQNTFQPNGLIFQPGHEKPNRFQQPMNDFWVPRPEAYHKPMLQSPARNQHQRLNVWAVPGESVLLPFGQDEEQLGGHIRTTSAPVPAAAEESPKTARKNQLQFKKFYSQFWKMAKDQDSEDAHNWALDQMPTLNKSIHWRVCMEIAELAKRLNQISRARKWYKEVSKLQPSAAQGWLERAKMEEECGELVKCQQIMSEGLHHCKYNESLLVRMIKHQERMGGLDECRILLGSLQNIGADKVWKVLLEGALMEARAGNIQTARRVFKYLIKHVSWCGPVYLEAGRMEEKIQEYDRAIAVVEQGLQQVPRHGPLWFLAMRLYYKSGDNLHEVREVVKRAVESISAELIWKVHYQAAQLEEQAGNYDRARTLFAETVKYCPDSLCWKTWLSGARLEARCNRVDVARTLLNRAASVVPKKMRSVVMLECSRLEECFGNVDGARKILDRARVEEAFEWKVFLETVLLELRCGNVDGAIEAAEKALKIHRSTGRLWAVLIQLKSRDGEATQNRIFKEAIKYVPKSGEVWCEGARIALSPTGGQFNLKAAQRYLKFAMKFTPQYGDTFIEYFRLKLLVDPASDGSLQRLFQICMNAEPNYGALWCVCKENASDTALQVMENAKKLILADLQRHRSLYNFCMSQSFYHGRSTTDKENIGADASNMVANISEATGTPLQAKSEASAHCADALISPAPSKLSKVPEALKRRWEEENANSLHVLYPVVGELTHQDKHRVLFAFEPIT